MTLMMHWVFTWKKLVARKIGLALNKPKFFRKSLETNVSNKIKLFYLFFRVKRNFCITFSICQKVHEEFNPLTTNVSNHIETRAMANQLMVCIWCRTLIFKELKKPLKVLEVGWKQFFVFVAKVFKNTFFT